MEESNESHHHQQQRLSYPYYNHHNQLQHHHPTTVFTGNAVTSSNNVLFPPPAQPNDGSSYPYSVPSSEPLKKKRGRPRKYVTPEQALAAKKMASSTTASSNSGSFKKSQPGKTGQSFTPLIINIPPGEDVALKIRALANESKHELCILSASGTISNVSLRPPVGNISYEGQYEILSLSGSFIRAETGGKTGGLSISLSDSDGQIIGGAIGTNLTAAGPVQVILGLFQFDRKKDIARSGGGGKEDASKSENRLTLPSSTGPIGFRLTREPMRGNNEQGQTGSHYFMMQAPSGMHMTQPRPSEWGGNGHDGRGGGGYDLSGRIGHESSENGD